MADVIIIGGGAAGMMAAGRAAECGATVLLLEKNKELGRKLSITGGGRCNITNATFDSQKLLKNYGDSAKFLFSPFAQFSVEDTINFFEERGLPIVVQARSRAFPKSEYAPDVTKTMRDYVNKTSRVETKLETQVLSVSKEDEHFTVVTKGQTFKSKRLIIAAGGTSHPETGSTGDGFKWLADLGHTVQFPNPNLVPLKVIEEEWTKAISGNSLTFMKIRFWQNGKVQFSKTGKILFTHFGLSGPLILNSSYDVIELLKYGSVEATIDMFPDTELPEVDLAIVKAFEKNSNKQLKNILKNIVPHGMTNLFLKKYDQELLDKAVNEITKIERRIIVDDLKSLTLRIKGTMGDDWAIIADGGVDLREIDTRTMESKIVPGLYPIGDSLHINRPSGGYSLQLCWTTGYVAGDNCN